MDKSTLKEASALLCIQEVTELLDKLDKVSSKMNNANADRNDILTEQHKKQLRIINEIKINTDIGKETTGKKGSSNTIEYLYVFFLGLLAGYLINYLL